MKISTRAKENPRSGIRVMFDLAKNYQDTVSLGIGEPSFATPPNIVQAGMRAIQEGYTKYTPNAGILELRQALAEKLKRDNGLQADPERNIIITTGACEAIMLALLALIDTGDEVIVHSPCWPNYYGQIALAGGRVVPVPTYEEDRFHLRADLLEAAISRHTRVLILNTPCNPTGAVLSREELMEIARVVQKYDIMVISDEPYEKIVFDGLRHISIGSLPGMLDRVVTVNSFSKTYAMTGWRVGYAHGPAPVIEQMVKLQECVSSCVNAAAQVACIEALRGPQQCVSEMLEEYDRRRKKMVEGLASLPGVTCALPEGTFYCFPNIKRLGRTSTEIANYWLEKAGVVTVPGSAFGPAGEGYLRVSFGSDNLSIDCGLNRLRAVVSHT